MVILTPSIVWMVLCFSSRCAHTSIATIWHLLNLSKTKFAWQHYQNIKTMCQNSCGFLQDNLIGETQVDPDETQLDPAFTVLNARYRRSLPTCSSNKALLSVHKLCSNHNNNHHSNNHMNQLPVAILPMQLLHPCCRHFLLRCRCRCRCNSWRCRIITIKIKWPTATG
jgi:hypothetical protein